jgi:hypothetical protein
VNPSEGLRFFAVGGAILIATGVLMLLVRPGKAHERGLSRYLNRPTIWAAFCVALGLVAMLIGLGFLRPSV